MCDICNSLNQSLLDMVDQDVAGESASNSIVAAVATNNVTNASDTSGSDLFEEVSSAANVTIDPDGFGNASSYGSAWTDFDDDSLPDFWINNHNIQPPSLRNLYLNQGDGTFTDIFPEVFSQEITGDPHGAAWADFDNDGDQDLIQISAGEGTAEGGGRAFPPISTPNWMFVNNEGVLVDRAEELGLSYVSAVAQTPIWLDFDNDGLLDLLHTSIKRPDGLFPTTIFRQTDDGFEDVGSTMLPAEVQSTSYNYGVLSDLTGDGRMEIILPKQDPKAEAAIILDTSTTPFTDLTTTLLPAQNLQQLFDWFTKDIAAADFNNDLRPDLYLARSNEDKLLINTDQGLVDRSEEAGINSVSNKGAFSVVAGDFDNDMDVDVYTITRQESENRLYENQGDGSFIAVPDAGGAPSSSVRNGDAVTMADYDLDGFLDLFIDSATETAYHQLYRNQGNDNNWLEIDLEGVETNRDGIGAQVFLTAGGVTQMREQTGGIHKWSQNHQRIHFGLADNTQVDLLEVRWPSGAVQQIENVEANQLLQITEELEIIDNGAIRIEAEDYAPGGQGISYQDSTVVNFGKAYRNDRVDIQPTSDEGGGFNVGWIRKGEWLTYDLNLPQDGTYNLVARVATPNDDRSFSASIGEQTATFEFDSTGGWQSWQDVVAEGLELTAGSQQLRVDVPTGRFNINYLELVPTSSIVGTDGDDNINGTDDDDNINGLAGNDTIRSGPGNDTIKGGDGNDFILSYDWQVQDNENDVVEGNAGNDRIRGGWGNDSITGGLGNDYIVGGVGEDTLSGGQGSDRFRFENLNQAGDTITDFSPAEDTFEIVAKLLDTTLEIGNLSTEQFVLGANAGDENDRFIYSQSSGSLFYDADGNGETTQTLLATLSNQAAVSSNDIVIV